MFLGSLCDPVFTEVHRDYLYGAKQSSIWVNGIASSSQTCSIRFRSPYMRKFTGVVCNA